MDAGFVLTTELLCAKVKHEWWGRWSHNLLLFSPGKMVQYWKGKKHCRARDQYPVNNLWLTPLVECPRLLIFLLASQDQEE